MSDKRLRARPDRSLTSGSFGVSGDRVAQVTATVSALGDPAAVAAKERFFQAIPGGYAEGDTFVAVSVPQLRRIARDYRDLSLAEVDEVLGSQVHEIRLLALIVMGEVFQRLRERGQMRRWLDVYQAAVRDGRVNNWDLVDTSAAPVLGHWCATVGDIGEITESAAAQELWKRRVGIVATHRAIRQGDATAILAVAPLVVGDRRDLIQKAFGWMLREMGKRVGRDMLLDYLNAHAATLGSTALSYATEHLDPADRARYRALRALGPGAR